MQNGPKYKRVILKVTGEALKTKVGHDIFTREAVEKIVTEVAEAKVIGSQIAIVVGGGNIFRGNEYSEGEYGMDPVTADHIGMLATIQNGLALKDRFEKFDINVRLMTSLPINAVAEPYNIHRADRHLEKGRVVIVAAGTGNPFCTTDSAAALRANELQASVLLKATKVDGIYDKDPKKFHDAVRFREISYAQALVQRIQVFDAEAFAACMRTKKPIIVFDFFTPGNLRRILEGEPLGTLVCETPAVAA